ncbi:AMP-binding protein [Streptomyces luteireticuli]|uniref:D-alanine--poly(Phosphoribitol) ligase n=1 Tax=Streptomyces luteireticuli TaxID=173858 RepID=A0ABN0YN35_9ACTN
MTDGAAYGLHGRFLRGLARAGGDGEALRADGRSVCYRELHRTALAWAGALLEATGGRPGVIGVLGNKTVDAYTATLAALYTGSAVVPLHPGFPEARTRRTLRAAGVTALVAAADAAPLLPGLLGPDSSLPVLVPEVPGVGTVELRPGQALDAPRTVEPGDTAYILFTSGSTGRPKGVPISHGSCAFYFRQVEERYDFTPQDVFSQTFDLTFDCAMFDLFTAWGSGGTLVAVEPGALFALPDFLAAQRVTVWFSTPSAIRLVRRTGGLAPGSLPALRWSLFAGEALKAEDVADWQRAAPAATVENLYGPTELTITITAHRWDPATSPDACVHGAVPIGRVHEGHDWLLADEDGAPGDPDAVEGELWVSGPQLTRGYLHRADDADRFPRHAGRIWYRTGDWVRRAPDGQLTYLGRIDHQVQVQGIRVELAEIDHAVRGCSGVEDAVTVATRDGDALELVVFYTGEARPPAQFARQLRQVLPPGTLPRHYEHLPALPLNANRKTDRTGLTTRAEALVGRRPAAR